MIKLGMNETFPAPTSINADPLTDFPKLYYMETPAFIDAKKAAIEIDPVKLEKIKQIPNYQVIYKILKEWQVIITDEGIDKIIQPVYLDAVLEAFDRAKNDIEPLTSTTRSALFPHSANPMLTHLVNLLEQFHNKHSDGLVMKYGVTVEQHRAIATNENPVVRRQSDVQKLANIQARLLFNKPAEKIADEILSATSLDYAKQIAKTLQDKPEIAAAVKSILQNKLNGLTKSLEILALEDVISIFAA